MTKKKNRDIRNIFIVLGSAVVGAILLSIALLNYYSPSGRYLAGNTLLDPSIMDQIHYQDQHPHTQKKVNFTFDHIEFSYFELDKRRMEVFPINLGTYQIFYKKVASNKSLEGAAKNIQSLFLQSHPALLTISMRTKEGSAHSTTSVFQVVQFTQEDYFRVQLHEQNEGEWAYFYQPGLYQEIMHLFAATQTST